MTKEEGLALTKKVGQTYENIASHFSLTRQNLWADFGYFAPFLQESQSILDIGCGNGRIIELLKNKHTNYTGIDISKNLLNEAIKQWGDANLSLRFLQMNALDIDTLEDEYDIILCTAVMQHLPKVLQAEFMEKIYSKLKPGGFLLMTNWNLNQKRFWGRLVINTSNRVFNRDKSFSPISLGLNDVTIPWTSQQDVFARYVYRFTNSEIKKLLINAKFKIIKSLYVKDGRDSNIFLGKNILSIAKK